MALGPAFFGGSSGGEALTGDVTKSAGSNTTTIANDAVTNAKAANMAQGTIKGRAAGAGTGDPTDLTAAQAAAIVASGKAAFHATLGGTNQTGVPDATFTKVAFNTEEFDDGGFFDTTNNRWTPPAGKIVLGVTVNMFGTWVAGALVFPAIFKNGVRLKNGFPSFSAAANGNVGGGLCMDTANGTDFYEIYVFMDVTTATTGTVFGAVHATYFFGYQS